VAHGPVFGRFVHLNPGIVAMLIFFKPRLVLFAIPKTATSALHLALRDKADVAALRVGDRPGKHISYADFRTRYEQALLGDQAGPFDYVGVMREPVSWLSSWHRFRQADRLDGKPASTKGVGFDQFVQDFCSPTPPTHAKFPAQSQLVCDAQGKVGINRLFRYDDMASLIRFLEIRLGHAIAVGQVNVSTSAARAELSANTLALYKSRFARDFEI
jgi:hypothetical protein